jgi:hypothetical protein
MAVLVATAAFVAPASAAKPASGSFTKTYNINTTFTVEAGGVLLPVDVTGSLTVTVRKFQADSDGTISVAGTLSGTVTLTNATLGTATLTINSVLVDVTADVDADCSTGRLEVTIAGSVDLDALVEFNLLGVTATYPVNETLSLNQTLVYDAPTPQQRNLICDIDRLTSNPSSLKALIDKLNTLLRKL